MNINETFNSKKLFGALTVLIIIAFICGQILINNMANNFKSQMIEHDYAVLGYISSNNLQGDDISKAFIVNTNMEDIDLGHSILQNSGYDTTVSDKLLPQINEIHNVYSLAMFIFIFTTMILIVLFIGFYIRGQNKKLDYASDQVIQFVSGDTSIRLYDVDEGSLSKLFYSINGMATSLTAHIEKEQHNRLFLKDTISDISHQLKTPLSALEMYNEIICDENRDNEVVERFSKKSMEELKRMEDLIQNLLKLAKLDSGQIELDIKEYNLKVFLESIINRFSDRVKAENKNIELICTDELLLRFDRIWLMESISNVIKNALDHTKENESVEITCEKNPLMTSIVIRDNGEGIHSDDIYYIFKRFYRSKFSKGKQGVGIGLTLTKSIVEQHGGSIVVDSKFGEGTEFTITFPNLSK